MTARISFNGFPSSSMRITSRVMSMQMPQVKLILSNSIFPSDLISLR
jgi:hypothetical protein